MIHIRIIFRILIIIVEMGLLSACYGLNLWILWMSWLQLTLEFVTLLLFL